MKPALTRTWVRATGLPNRHPGAVGAGLRLLGGMTVAALVGCATPGPGDAVSALPAQWLPAGTPPLQVLVDADARRASDARRRQLLAEPLTESRAVALALDGSPALQALLAEGWRLQADQARSGSPTRIGLSFERIVEDGAASWTRSLSFGLSDLLTWPLRQAASERARAASRLRLARDVLALQAAARQQWVRAVAARQAEAYREQVLEVAEAGAELARRMQAVGNFSRLQRSREELAVLDAGANLSRARQVARAESEALVRLLGLTEADAAALKWPERLPDVPLQPRDAGAVARDAVRERIDLQLAAAEWSVASGMPWRSEAVDVEASVIRERSPDGARGRGAEIALSLPWPTEWAQRRAGARAAELAAAARLEQARVDAASLLRERYAGYRSAHELARQHRDQLVPLRKSITDDMLLRYNGMLVGVFELLADARAQVASVIAALDAERDFWLADAALDAAVLGVPAAMPGAAPAAMAAESSSSGGH